MSYLAGSSIASATQMASCGVWLGDIRFLEVKLSFSISEAILAQCGPSNNSQNGEY